MIHNVLKKLWQMLVWLAVTVRKMVRAVSRTMYAISNRRPYRWGYSAYKYHFLANVIHNDRLLSAFRNGGVLPTGYGFRLDARVLEIPWIFSRIASMQGALLDAGSSLNHECMLRAPALSNKSVTIVTLAPESTCLWRKGISYVFGDIRHLYFKDNSFDMVTCVSTIEHVGMDNAMYTRKSRENTSKDKYAFINAVKELRRILKPGGALFLTFPFGQYEDHGWFQQFDSECMDRLIDAFQPAKYTETIFKYEADGWKVSDRAACKQCEYFDVHTTRYFNRTSSLGFPPDYPAAERAVACMELFK